MEYVSHLYIYLVYDKIWVEYADKMWGLLIICGMCNRLLLGNETEIEIQDSYCGT